MRRITIVWVLLVAMLGGAFAESVKMPSESPTGMTLVRTSSADNIAWTKNASQRLGTPHSEMPAMHIARYIRSDLTEGTEDAAKSSRYGLFYNGVWLVRPEWSGLYPINSDNALVRKPDTQHWYHLNVVSGKSKKIGTGDIGIADVLHAFTTKGLYSSNATRYYLIDNDDGIAQTIRIIKWKHETGWLKRELQVGPKLNNVISRSHPSAKLPMQITYDGDFIVRVLDKSGAVVDRMTTVRGEGKKPAPRMPLFFDRQAYYGPFVYTSPERYLFREIDAERQLYVPVASNLDYAVFLDEANKAQGGKLLGTRPIGKSVTTDIKDVPLEMYPDSGLAVVWEKPEGLRLAPVFGSYDSSCVPGSGESCTPRYVGAAYFAYPQQLHIRTSSYWANYIRLEYIEIPETLKDTSSDKLVPAAGIRAFYPNGEVDIFLKMSEPELQKPRDYKPFYSSTNIINIQPLANRADALAFEQNLLTSAGMESLLNQGALANAQYADEKRGEAEAARIAALSPEERAELARRQRMVEWNRQRQLSEEAEKQRAISQIDAALAKAEYGTALEIADGAPYSVMGYVVPKILSAGGGDFVTNDDLRDAIAVLYRNPSDQEYVQYYLSERVPAPVRAAPSAGWGGMTRNEQAVRDRYLGASATPSRSNTLQDAQDRSRAAYNRGANSQYLCGASTFCD